MVHPNITKDADKYTMPIIVWIYLGVVLTALLIGGAFVWLDIVRGYFGTTAQLLAVIFLIDLVVMATPIWGSDVHSSKTLT